MERRVGAPNFGRRPRRTQCPIRYQRINILGLAATATPATNLLRAPPRRFILHFLRARHHQRRIPEGVPAVLVDHLFCQLDAGCFQRVRLVVRHPADAADDVILRREVFAERGPLAAGFPDRQIPNHRLTAVDRVARAQVGAVLAGPRHDQQILLDAGREALRRLVLRQVAVQ